LAGSGERRKCHAYCGATWCKLYNIHCRSAGAGERSCIFPLTCMCGKTKYKCACLTAPIVIPLSSGRYNRSYPILCAVRAESPPGSPRGVRRRGSRPAW
jgi:hypothetical protein